MQQRSTARWAAASFFSGLGALALLAPPLAAICFGSGSQELADTLIASIIVAAISGVVVVLALDLLNARSRAMVRSRQASPRHRRRPPTRVRPLL
ncbi:MAG: hypothetical protein JOZ56_08420 [Actinobacteria bacterium]|nr:hypothetical protein [Actinomycetota bacterium]MBV8563100.1 hypothetical protein [Actinomycetota bacterium]